MTTKTTIVELPFLTPTRKPAALQAQPPAPLPPPPTAPKTPPTPRTPQIGVVPKKVVYTAPKLYPELSQRKRQRGIDATDDDDDY
jgi:hypothetical protein